VETGFADNGLVDAINSLVASTQRAQVLFDAAAERIASADLPTESTPDPTNPAAPQPSTDVDVAEQMITMMVAVDAHHRVNRRAPRRARDVPSKPGATGAVGAFRSRLVPAANADGRTATP